jgi:hypothetical protein
LPDPRDVPVCKLPSKIGLWATCLSLAIAGCGGNVIVPKNAATDGGLVLSDSVTANHFGLTVVDGALTLTQVSGSGTLPEPGLTDTLTGTNYSLAVDNGALMLSPGPGGAASIGLSDSLTERTYALVVTRGALTLISDRSDGT